MEEAVTDTVRTTLQAISVGQIRRHIQALQGVRHPVAAPAALERAADHINTQFRSLGYDTSEHHFAEDGREYRNIIGAKWGSWHREKRVVVLAHYDTEIATPGANDNASGVAVLLELARAIAPLTFESSVVLAGVTLEEWNAASTDPRIARGSRALAAHAAERAWDIAGVIVLEGVAFAGGSVVQRVPPGVTIDVPQTGNFIAVVGNQRSAALVQGFVEAIAHTQSVLPCVPLVVPGNGEALPDTRRSDHVPFWDLGHKAIMITDTADFRNPHHHQPSDTLETLNLPFAADVCRAVTGLVIDMVGWRASG